jgi:hypothetical protein
METVMLRIPASELERVRSYLNERITGQLRDKFSVRLSLGASVAGQEILFDAWLTFDRVEETAPGTYTFTCGLEPVTDSLPHGTWGGHSAYPATVSFDHPTQAEPQLSLMYEDSSDAHRQLLRAYLPDLTS